MKSSAPGALEARGRVGFYDRFVFPRLLDLAMRNPEVARYRALLVPRARGTVVEIGIGSS